MLKKQKGLEHQENQLLKEIKCQTMVNVCLYYVHLHFSMFSHYFQMCGFQKKRLEMDYYSTLSSSNS